jgi:hypothetical protein
MGILTDVIDELEAELHQSAVPADASDEHRLFALMAIQAGAEEGDEAAKATMAAVERLFARVACHGQPQKPSRVRRPGRWP